MELHELLQYFVYTSLGIGGWFLKSLWDAVVELREDMHRIREDIGKNYMPRDEIRELHMDILEAIRDVKNEIKQRETREYAWHQQITKDLSHKADK